MTECISLSHPQKLLGKEMAYFQLHMEWCWNRLDGKFESLQEEASNGQESEMENKEKGGKEEEEEEEEKEK